jgi:carbamoyl-phosphate synthase small subunit
VIVRPPAILALEDGTVFRGTAFGASVARAGEVVFNTSLSGYQEVLSDPSYRGQIVTMTSPHIGNYGVTPEDMESHRLWLSGFVVREQSRMTSNYRATGTLAELLEEHGVPGIEGVDTRALTRRIRLEGAMRSVLSTGDVQDADELVDRARAAPHMTGRDLASEVTCERIEAWTEGPDPALMLDGWEPRPRDLHVVAVDFGAKWNILRSLVAAGFSVTRVPATTTAEEILALKPDGVFLSNGPGDPEPVTYAHDTVRGLLGKLPIFGICLGHQILGLALGMKTYKLKFGHHGSNQPVKDLTTGRIEITAQNHGFAVDLSAGEAKGLELTHVNLNDQTVEGFRHRGLSVLSVQHHPEASPGPHDSMHLFDRFRKMIEAF